MRILIVSLLITFSSPSVAEEPRTVYFADGYHGGVYGHYPPGYTGFIVERLKANPDWKINLEIEPPTWDVARVSEPAAYRALKAIMDDQSDAGRVEIVNPTYAQKGKSYDSPQHPAFRYSHTAIPRDQYATR